jgi:hypothetical protein
VKIGVEIVPEIIEENGDAVVREILRDKIEGKGVSRRTACRPRLYEVIVGGCLGS